MSEPITEAMLKAGGEAIATRESGRIDYDEMAAAVFRAMEAARDADRVELSRHVPRCLCGTELDENGRCPRQESEYAAVLAGGTTISYVEEQT